MTDRYLATDGDDEADGLTDETPWASLAKALTTSGWTTLYVAAGTYVGSAAATVSGTAADPLLILPSGAGEVIFEGDGPRTIDLRGRSHIEIRGVTIRNDGPEWSGSLDAKILGVDVGTSPALNTGTGASFITLRDCTFEQCNKPNNVNSYASALAIYSHGDERLGGTATHHIQVIDCSFADCDMFHTAGGIYHAFVSVSGNVHDLLLDGNTIDGDGSANASSIDTGGGQLPTSYPDQPRRIVFRRNTIRNITDNYGLYLNALADTLFECNTIEACKYGIGIVAEDPGYHATPYQTRRVWVRNNLIVDCPSTAIVLGAFTAAYRDNVDAWVTHNTVYRATSNPGAPMVWFPGYGADGVSGDSRFAGNIVSAPDRVLLSQLPGARETLLDRNLWCSNAAAPFYWNGVSGAFPYSTIQDRHGKFQAQTVPAFLSGSYRPRGIRRGAIGTPSWCRTGQFGTYDPGERLDVYGRRFKDGWTGAASGSIFFSFSVSRLGL